jgi:hypothetical protein
VAILLQSLSRQIAPLLGPVTVAMLAFGVPARTHEDSDDLRMNRVVETLYSSGARATAGRAVVLFDARELSTSEGDLLAKAVAQGLDDIERLLLVSFRLQQPLEFFVTPEFGGTSYSTLSPPRVFLALDRVRERTAPFIHEAVHHLVYGRAAAMNPDAHLWINEGFANYVQAVLADRSEYLQEHPMIPANERVDAVARAALATSVGQYVVTFVGRPGSPAGLEDRDQVGRPFYVLSQSLTKYLIHLAGVQRFAAEAVPSLWQGDRFAAVVQEMTGKPLEQLRSDWLTRLESER